MTQFSSIMAASCGPRRPSDASEEPRARNGATASRPRRSDASPTPIKDWPNPSIFNLVVYLGYDERNRNRTYLHRLRTLGPGAPGADQRARPGRTGAPDYRARSPARDRCAPPPSASRLLQPVRLRGARTGLHRGLRVAADQGYALECGHPRRARLVAGRLAQSEQRCAAAERLRALGPQRSRARRHRSPGRRNEPSAARRVGSNGGGHGSGCAIAGVGCPRPTAVGGAGGGQEYPAGAADAGRGGSRVGAADGADPGAGRRPLGAEGSSRRGVSAGVAATEGVAVARGPAPDHGATRGTAGV